MVPSRAETLTEMPPPSEPLLSVVIPSAGDSKMLAKCLESLARQDCADPFEVIVVLDGSPPGDSGELAALRKRSDWPWSLRWVDLGQRLGPGGARNRGCAVSEGRFVLFLDDDMTAAEELVRGHLDILLSGERVTVLGQIDTTCRPYRGVYAYFVESYWGLRRLWLSRGEQLNHTQCFSGNLSLALDFFREVGGFDETLDRGEDLELGIRLERLGVRFVYGVSAGAHQDYTKTPEGSVRDAEANGRTAARLWRKYPETRRTWCFAVSSTGRDNARWFRALALARDWRWDRFAWLLPRIPARHWSHKVAWFLHDLAHARGVRAELGDDGLWTALSSGALMLCYHNFTRGPADKFTIPVDTFERQLRFLLKQGYRFLTVSQWIQACQAGEPPKGLTAVVTIDDGHAAVYTLAAPVLERLGIPATLYLTVAWVGIQKHLLREQIQDLESRGWEIGSHSLTHPWLDSETEEKQQEEVEASRQALAEKAGCAIPTTFAYPFGGYNATTAKITRDAGYAAAVTVEEGFAYMHHSPWELPRLVVDGRWSMFQFRAHVGGWQISSVG